MSGVSNRGSIPFDVWAARRHHAEPIPWLYAACDEIERLREALESIERGDWNLGNVEPGLTVLEFVRRVLAGEDAGGREQTGRTRSEFPAVPRLEVPK